ncbi:hypothetical protein SBBP2_680024 [Burkholderiales bacterium]|nr:hypothetical protein SBBP2_680024 [Burkholderiales bacterium]
MVGSLRNMAWSPCNVVRGAPQRPHLREFSALFDCPKVTEVGISPAAAYRLPARAWEKRPMPES